MPDPAAEDRDVTRRTWLAAERTWLAWWRSGVAVGAVALAVGRFLPGVSHGKVWPFRLLGMIILMGQRASAGSKRIFEILDKEPEIVDRPGAVDLVECRGDVVKAERISNEVHAFTFCVVKSA